MLATTPTLADPVQLQDVIRDALQGSLSLHRAKNKIDSAKGQLLEAKSPFDWTALAQTGWQRFFAPGLTGVSTGSGFVDAWRTTVGVTKEFSNGISMSPGVTTLITPGIKSLQALGYQQVLPTINLTIPLDRGLGTENADANERAATASLRGSRLDYDYALQKAVHDAVQIFWRCLAAADQRMVMLESDQQQTDYEHYLQEMVSRGQLEPETVQRAQADHALSEENIERANEGVWSCRRELASAVGVGGRAMLEPTGDLPHPERYGPAIAKLQPESLVAYALDNRRDLRALKSYVEAQRDRLKGAKDELNPKVDVVLDPFQAFVRYSQSINRYGAKGHIAEIMSAESDAEIALEQGRQSVRSDIENAITGLQELWRGWPMLIGAQHNLQHMEETTEQRVRAGTADRSALRAAQDDLARAKHATFDTRLRLASILASLRLYTGTVALDGDTSKTIATEFSTLPQP
ncbi:MAG TPA: TolC family protein [Stellaceae bacterium]|nr:TolC family protein [Stellaceae bacterium]